MKFNAIAFTVLMVIFSSFANATLIDNTNYFTDTDSGHDWLKLSETVNYSYNDILIQLQAGGDFYGWELATFDNVFELFDNAGGDSAYKTATHSTSNNVMNAILQPLFGYTNAVNQTWFHVKDFTPGGVTSGFILYEGTGRVSKHKDGYSHAYMEYDFVGTALRRISTQQQVSIPEPSTITILVLGMIGLASRRFKK
ncbi:PEP-CTERM sorting domain-containing protein [Colwellia sp. D2M02]|uniref:PEP-CTERM sorting domain-containing protein n=1 Tax=Colwellia sp. D2M02 TaxID=2841562 RepID=UPI001C08AB31|nr:PEP-CTERM sorting domain-containing protein [Colwellia sp. D2M02]MBU2894401.1 PEP-CTERM sorting domain-containing protein [Colwellia sp. D2M02]